MGKDELRVAEETILPNEDAVTDEFVEFLKRASERRHPSGELRRFNQPRHAGCAHAQLIVSDDLAAELKVGVFARPGAYDTRVRFASASPSTDRDRDIRGMSIRVEGVPGSNLTAGAGGFQDAPVIRRVLERGSCDAVSIARPLIASNDLVKTFAQGHDSPEVPCTYCNRCPVNAPENPLGCYDETRFETREVMVRDIMSVFDPPPFH